MACRGPKITPYVRTPRTDPIDFKYLTSKIKKMNNAKELSKRDVDSLLYYWGPDWADLFQYHCKKG